jgi:hypothetical protein
MKIGEEKVHPRDVFKVHHFAAGREEKKKHEKVIFNVYLLFAHSIKLLSLFGYLSSSSLEDVSRTDFLPFASSFSYRFAYFSSARRRRTFLMISIIFRIPSTASRDAHANHQRQFVDIKRSPGDVQQFVIVP